MARKTERDSAFHLGKGFLAMALLTSWPDKSLFEGLFCAFLDDQQYPWPLLTTYQLLTPTPT